MHQRISNDCMLIRDRGRGATELGRSSKKRSVPIECRVSPTRGTSWKPSAVVLSIVAHAAYIVKVDYDADRSLGLRRRP